VRDRKRAEAASPATDDDGNVEITGRDLREKMPPVGQGSLFDETATAGVL
jgi:hypothetical protein